MIFFSALLYTCSLCPKLIIRRPLSLEFITTSAFADFFDDFPEFLTCSKASIGTKDGKTEKSSEIDWTRPVESYRNTCNWGWFGQGHSVQFHWNTEAFQALLSCTCHQGQDRKPCLCNRVLHWMLLLWTQKGIQKASKPWNLNTSKPWILNTRKETNGKTKCRTYF